MTSSGFSGAGDWVVFGGDLHEAVFHFVEELTSVVVPSLLQSLPSQLVDHSYSRDEGWGLVRLWGMFLTKRAARL